MLITENFFKKDNCCSSIIQFLLEEDQRKVELVFENNFRNISEKDKRNTKLIIDDTFTPKRILVSSLSLRPKNHVVALGTIIEQSSGKITILSRQNEEVNFNINTKTQYQDQSGEVARNSEFSEDIQVLIVGDEDDDGKNASIIRSLVSLEALQDNEQI